MAEISWEKPAASSVTLPTKGSERWKFMIGAVLLLVAVVYLVISGTMNGAQYFMTVDELVNNPDLVGKTVRISGAVDGNTIAYDGENLVLDFTIANIPTETTDLALTLHQAVSDTAATRLTVHMEGEVKPDLLQHEAQAIMTGVVGADGVFYATELLLKCPSRYEEGVPEQVES
ncbi:MAG: cytochrome c maturation protein CcmE [Anaerolineae bacterium]|uniref:cytochrome c maturation protein CcmE n=1 Tax=Candidatus Flexifilum breve TaxID=3140694 RepID=UPI001AD0BC08|nr:cytochrome c maturation protein CcmE [Chloroflexota bacterium]MBK9746138.1 cytochrome c maturation protein CcmE [Chloroflexota bacterium]MBN8634779.1 cytochrome c maturation protein CcmE [Anaerolineae bacterium]